MSEYNLTSQSGCSDGVPIKVNRVFDSCSDKDCLSDLQVTLHCGELPQNINIVKTRCVTVDDVCISVAAVPFNKGFYSIDLTFTFNLEILGYERACTTPQILTGTAFVTKNCILYGSESATKTFFSDGTASSGTTDECCNTVNLPTAIVSVVEPIALETKICKTCVTNDACSKSPCSCQRAVFVTLGLFSVVELTRPVTVMVPTLDYTIPRKECCTDFDSPCDIFERLKFPSEEFSPLTLNDNSCVCANNSNRFGCGGSTAECECREFES